jgi:hypothetical protein
MKLAKQNVTCIFPCRACLPAPRSVWNALPAVDHVACSPFVTLHSERSTYYCVCARLATSSGYWSSHKRTLPGASAASAQGDRRVSTLKKTKALLQICFQAAYWLASCQLVTSPGQSIVVQVCFAKLEWCPRNAFFILPSPYRTQVCEWNGTLFPPPLYIHYKVREARQLASWRRELLCLPGCFIKYPYSDRCWQLFRGPGDYLDRGFSWFSSFATGKYRCYTVDQTTTAQFIIN